MIDRCGRTIDYLRISLTDRCNLRCRYCMPDEFHMLSHSDILTYEELLTTAQAAVQLGITHFKITGGEPLVRRGCVSFLKQLKALPGVETVTLTTNGVLLEPILPELVQMQLDGVNISLDTLDRDGYRAIAGSDHLDTVLHSINACAASGLHTKLNCVLLSENKDQILPLIEFANQKGIDVRFIELMPIGAGSRSDGLSGDDALEIIRTRWPDLHPVSESRGFGPAHYYASQALRSRVGMIAAVSHKFCKECNRIRLTSTGRLKPCLCFGESVNLRPALQSEEENLPAILYEAINQKPEGHRFNERGGVTESDLMSQIGG